MGLDMSIYKYNKKMDKDTFDNIVLARKYDTEYDEFVKEAGEILKSNDYNSKPFIDFCQNHVSQGLREKIVSKPVREEVFNESGDLLKEHKNYENYLEKHAKYVEKTRQMLHKDLSYLMREKKAQQNAYYKHKDLLKELGDSKEVCYWRKHSDLNGYMEDLYYERGGDKDFNCEPLLLEKEDVECIILDHKKHLDETNEFEIGKSSGFFWGETTKENWEQSLEDFEQLLKETDWENSTVYYHCWW